MKVVDRLLTKKYENVVESGRVRPISESSISKVWEYTKRPFIVITAFRGSYTNKENLGRNVELLQQIKANGLGAIKLVGHWLENAGTENETDVKEISFLVPMLDSYKGDIESFKALGIEFMHRFSQEGIIFSDGGGVHLLLQNGDDIVIGKSIKVNPTKIENGFSQIKGKQFVFEGWVSAGGYISGLALKHQGLLF